MVVCVVDGVEEFARLGEEGSDLSVVPSREDALSIGHEFDAVALEAWNLNSEEFLSALGVPDTDVIGGAGSKEIRVARWEGNVVDTFAVASVSQFWCNSVGVAPVDGSLRGSSEEVGGIGS